MIRILIVEDDQANRAVATKMLELEGYDVVEAASADEGLDLYRRESIDLVVVDIFMPEKDGLEVIRELRRDSSSIGIIAVGAGGPEALAMAKQTGANQTIAKPYQRDTLVGTIQELLGHEGSRSDK